MSYDIRYVNRLNTQINKGKKKMKCEYKPENDCGCSSTASSLSELGVLSIVIAVTLIIGTLIGIGYLIYG